MFDRLCTGNLWSVWFNLTRLRAWTDIPPRRGIRCRRSSESKKSHFFVKFGQDQDNGSCGGSSWSDGYRQEISHRPRPRPGRYAIEWLEGPVACTTPSGRSVGRGTDGKSARRLNASTFAERGSTASRHGVQLPFGCKWVGYTMELSYLLAGADDWLDLLN